MEFPGEFTACCKTYYNTKGIEVEFTLTPLLLHLQRGHVDGLTRQVVLYINEDSSTLDIA